MGVFKKDRHIILNKTPKYFDLLDTNLVSFIYHLKHAFSGEHVPVQNKQIPLPSGSSLINERRQTTIRCQPRWGFLLRRTPLGYDEFYLTDNHGKAISPTCHSERFL